MHIKNFIIGSLKLIFKGSKVYMAWMAFLLILIAIGCATYIDQLKNGLIVTSMRDQVSWGFYIGNFTFLVGVAAAAIVLVIPAYVYNWKPIKEIVILGELLAISAIIMCVLFVIVDLGHPELIWHMIPWIGRLHLQNSVLAWDSVVLFLYLILNLIITFHILYRTFNIKKLSNKYLIPIIYISIPAGIAIHTVTAFLYNGISARPFWNSAILAPRFLASAFCSGPAIMLILFQILRKTTRLKIKNEALWKIAELMAYTMFINLFLTGAEIFKEFYSNSEHFIYTQYLYFGVGEHKALVPYIWIAMAFDLIAFVLFLVPKTRMNFITLNIGAVLIFFGVYIEKGIGLIIPGFSPDTLGEIFQYIPSKTEILITAGIFSVGFLIYTLLLKVAVPIILGEFDYNGNRMKSNSKIDKGT
jgi:molybdopterin-containing oxidoreductase family membrane subunit